MFNGQITLLRKVKFVFLCCIFPTVCYWCVIRVSTQLSVFGVCDASLPGMSARKTHETI